MGHMGHMGHGLTFDELDERDVDRLLTKERVRAERGRWLRCNACRQRVTSTGARMSLQGAHTHTFTNPHGIAFRIGLFQEAHGCALRGTATEEWTWFPGTAWQVGVCRGCYVHLGWGFRAVPGTPGASPDRYYGLILDRLTEA